MKSIKVILTIIYVLAATVAQAAYTVTWSVPGYPDQVYACDSYVDNNDGYFYCYQVNQHPISIVRVPGDSISVE